MKIWGRLAAAAVAAVLVTGCAGQVVAGTGGPGVPTRTTVPTGTGADRTDCVTTPTPEIPADGVRPSTPTGSPLITITQGTNAWIASYLTQPYDIAIYPDGTAIRTEELGTMSDPVPELTIGWVDRCVLAAAVDELAELSRTDLGDAGITDQGTTTVTVHDPAGEFVVDVYALGVGDEYVADADQRAARERLTDLIGELRDGLTHTATWTPDRVRVSLLGNPADPTGTATWPLPGTIDQALDNGQRVPCAVFAGDDAAAILAELGAGPAGSSWTDGSATVVLAVGVLIPGQGCATR